MSTVCNRLCDWSAWCIRDAVCKAIVSFCCRKIFIRILVHAIQDSVGREFNLQLIIIFELKLRGIRISQDAV